MNLYESIKNNLNNNSSLKESGKMNSVKYDTKGYTRLTDGKYKGEPIVNYKEKDFKKGTSVLTPFVCSNCGKEFYIKSNIHDFFQQGDFDDPYEIPKEDMYCPKCKKFDFDYNGEVLIKEPGSKSIDESGELDFRASYKDTYGDTPDFTDMRRIINALEAICEQADEDGFNFCHHFEDAIAKLSKVNEDLEEFYDNASLRESDEPTDEEISRYEDLCHKASEKEKAIRLKAGSQAVMLDDLDNDMYLDDDYRKRVYAWTDDDLALAHKVESYLDTLDLNESTTSGPLYVFHDVKSDNREEAESYLHNFRSEAPNLRFEVSQPYRDGMWAVDFIGSKEDIEDYLVKLGYYDRDEVSRFVVPYDESFYESNK